MNSASKKSKSKSKAKSKSRAKSKAKTGTDGKRSFALIDSKGNKSGRYLAHGPGAAAKKAFTQKFGDYNKHKITIQETTRGSSGKSNTYEGSKRN
jgi:hypothetical protein